jgi:hypothetical protein
VSAVYVVKKGDLYWDGWDYVPEQRWAFRYYERDLPLDEGERIVKLVPRTREPIGWDIVIPFCSLETAKQIAADMIWRTKIKPCFSIDG